jgi:hypothetical protein
MVGADRDKARAPAEKRLEWDVRPPPMIGDEETKEDDEQCQGNGTTHGETSLRVGGGAGWVCCDLEPGKGSVLCVERFRGPK